MAFVRLCTLSSGPETFSDECGFPVFRVRTGPHREVIDGTPLRARRPRSPRCHPRPCPIQPAAADRRTGRRRAGSGRCGAGLRPGHEGGGAHGHLGDVRHLHEADARGRVPVARDQPCCGPEAQARLAQAIRRVRDRRAGDHRQHPQGHIHAGQVALRHGPVAQRHRGDGGARPRRARQPWTSSWPQRRAWNSSASTCSPDRWPQGAFGDPGSLSEGARKPRRDQCGQARQGHDHGAPRALLADIAKQLG